VSLRIALKWRDIDFLCLGIHGNTTILSFLRAVIRNNVSVCVTGALSSDVTKTPHVETEAKTEAAGFETESVAKAVASEAEADRGSIPRGRGTRQAIVLADRNNGRAFATLLRPCVCDVVYCGC